jgi:hypothetical protein
MSASVAVALVGNDGAVHEAAMEQLPGIHGVAQSSACASGACDGSIPASPFVAISPCARGMLAPPSCATHDTLLPTSDSWTRSSVNRAASGRRMSMTENGRLRTPVSMGTAVSAGSTVVAR